jgi:O-antigen/teichoic acid export membrane protein
MKSHLLISLPMILSAFVQLINGKVNILMLGYYVSKTDLGIFSMVFKITTITNFVLMAMKTIAMPKISELFWANKLDELKDLVHLTNRYIFIFSSVVFVLLLLFSDWILAFLGQEYVSGSTSFKILAFTQFYNAYCGMVAVFLNMTGHQKFFFGIIFSYNPFKYFIKYILDSSFRHRWGRLF